ncbi:MAG: chemotaxis response regulator protein-glutamate methylesterase, partial [Syntrophomonadaceae bacterium]|nr:chemotaxis response regulator protein-glutamate methylesterase [Syntrophomonadaceae bacterium]
MKPIRVLIVDDSVFVRQVISDIVAAQPDMEVAGTARNGAEALERLRELRPDVVTLDIEMPVMDGLTALKAIMASRPLPVVMLSSLTSKGAEMTVRALQAGAVDFVTKPSGKAAVDIAQVGEELAAKLRVAAGARPAPSRPLTGIPTGFIPGTDPKRSGVAAAPTAGTPALAPRQVSARQPGSAAPGRRPLPQPAPGPEAGAVPARPLRALVVIATSTGGPRALAEVLSGLPGDLPAAVLVVQHMPPGFTRSLAERLDGMSPLRVKEAEDGDLVLPGTVYLAPGDFHMRVKRGPQGGGLQVALSQDPPVGKLRPAADPLFASVAAEFDGRVVGVILTGMGRDATEGLLALKQRGARFVAEDESTCVVFGMPRSAIATGQVDRVLPLPEIAPCLVSWLAEAWVAARELPAAGPGATRGTASRRPGGLAGS